MVRKYIASLVLLFPLTVLANFSSSSDSTWNYHFDTYSNVGGILEENKATPIYTIDQSVLDTMLNSLPENRRADYDHPEYFPAPEPEIVVKESAEVFVTFYHEGAGYKNALGYYTYDGDTNRTRPASLQDVKDNGVILFANGSLLHSGGDLTQGTSVSLGELSAGTKVIFFLVSNGWKGSATGVRSASDWIFTSWSPLNISYDAASALEVPNHKHVALLWNNVGPGNILLMGFEDILRTHGACDHDYNDALFSVSSSPMSALSDTTELETGVSGFSLAPEERDSDEDGVNDAFDAYPDDAERAYVSYYPKKDGKATLVFEDMWPREGDYDMNDLSIGFSIKEVKNANHEVKDIVFSGEVQSYGAGYTNGFAINIDTPILNIASAQMKNGNDAEYSILDTMQDNNNTAVVKIFNDASDYLGHFVNVHKNEGYVQSNIFEITITLETAAKLSDPPYNPFLVVTKALQNDEGSYTVHDNIEVHLPNNMPTVNTPMELFGTLDDTSNLSQNRTYLTGNDKPWALLIPTYFAHPAEHVNIKDAYTHYLDWVQSDGQTHNDWYVYTKRNAQDNLYADENKIIIQP